jgi:hypothetical protein
VDLLVVNHAAPREKRSAATRHLRDADVDFEAGKIGSRPIDADNDGDVAWEPTKA